MTRPRLFLPTCAIAVIVALLLAGVPSAVADDLRVVYYCDKTGSAFGQDYHKCGVSAKQVSRDCSPAAAGVGTCHYDDESGHGDGLYADSALLPTVCPSAGGEWCYGVSAGWEYFWCEYAPWFGYPTECEACFGLRVETAVAPDIATCDETAMVGIRLDLS